MTTQGLVTRRSLRKCQGHKYLPSVPSSLELLLLSSLATRATIIPSTGVSHSHAASRPSHHGPEVCGLDTKSCILHPVCFLLSTLFLVFLVLGTRPTIRRFPFPNPGHSRQPTRSFVLKTICRSHER